MILIRVSKSNGKEMFDCFIKFYADTELADWLYYECRNNEKIHTYGTAQLQLHFYTRGHAWHHAVFCVDGARFLRGKLICHESIRGISTG